LQPSWAPSGTAKLTFDDEFSGTSLDTSKWENGWFGGTQPINSDELACYGHSHVTVSGGTLNLLLTHDNTCGKPYTGAAVDSIGKFAQTGGSFEARVFLPDDGHGNAVAWPAWWLNGPDNVPWPQHGEIDVVEGLSGSPETAAHVHYDNNNDRGWTAPTGMTGWHTYGVKWDAATQFTQFYWDGRLVWSAQFPPAYPEYLVLDFTMGQDSHVPSGPVTMKVDWVRVWK
jgi:beta-glucanase (GH16 family)